MQQALFISPLLLSALIFNLYLVQVLSRLLTRASDSCSSSAIKSTKLLSSGDSSAAYASIMFFESIRHNSLREVEAEGGVGMGWGRMHSFIIPTVVLNNSSSLPVI